MPLATKFTGKRLGILGLGRIGRAIAKRASGFDMAIAYTDQRAFDDVPYRFEPSLVALARDSDILVVAAAGGPASQKLVNREVLDALGPEGILVNVARGSVVDEAALVEALRYGPASAVPASTCSQHEPQRARSPATALEQCGAVSRIRRAPRTRPGRPWASSCSTISPRISRAEPPPTAVV